MTTVHSFVPHPTTTVTPYAHSSGPYQLQLNRRPTSPISPVRRCAVSPGARMDPPRPLEPRPTHDSTPPLHDVSRSERRPDIFGYASHATSAPRTSLPPPISHTLPSVRDILSPPAGPPLHPPQESWTSQSHGHQRLHLQDYQHRQPVAHAPVAYPPRPEPYAPPHPQARRQELPIIETQPVQQQQQQQHYQPQHHHHHSSSITSPYHPYRDSYREPTEPVYSRPRQQSTSSYATGSVSSPYTPNTYDEVASRGSVANYDKATQPTLPPSGTESSKRYLGVQEFAEGRFHVYEDGHRIPTEVDGETVNPQWGLTKANKPRKRLAIACLDCREKKIKCEPGASSCLQCEKAKRPCRRGPSNQSQHEGSTSNDWSSNAGSPPATATSASDIPTHLKKEPQSIKRRATDELPTASDAQKRQKSTSPVGQLRAVSGGVNGDGLHGQSPSGSQLPFTQTQDPVTVDRELTLQLLNTYMSTTNKGVYALFPRERFMRWAVEHNDKTPEEIMVLHAMMAVAAIYHRPAAAGVGEHCAQLASKAVSARFGRFSLRATHTRLLLALYSFAKGEFGESWEHCGAAMRSNHALMFYNDMDCAAKKDQNDSKSREDYGLTYNQITECRRRTFWCGFMSDQLHGFCEGMLCTVDKADVYLRLPCADGIYEHGGPSHGPIFNNGISDSRNTEMVTTSDISDMAHLVLVLSIWADVMKFVARGVHRSEEGHAADYERFYQQTYARLKEWRSGLPSRLQYSLDNVRHSVHQGYAGEFVMMHILYHCTLVKLNRWVRWSLMQDKIARNICEAHIHAGKVLSVVVAFNDAKAQVTPGHGQQHHFSTPFVGYAVFSAIDVVSAGGHDNLIKQTISNIQNAQTFLHALGAYWGSAAQLAKTADTRFQQLRNIIVRPYKAKSGCWLGREWGMEEPLETEFTLVDDCIYGVLPNTYFEALDKIRAGTHSLAT